MIKKFKILTVLLFSIFVFQDAQSQGKSYKDRIQVSFAYGLAYIDYAKDYSSDQPNFSFDAVGSLIDINLDYSLPKNRYIGIGFSKQIHARNIDDADFSRATQAGLILDNYRYTHLKNFYDIHFKKRFENNIELSVGAFYYQDYFNTFGFEVPDLDSFNYILSNGEQSSDNFGVFASPAYFFRMNEYVDLGIKGRVGLSLNGLEHIGLMPAINVRF